VGVTAARDVGAPAAPRGGVIDMPTGAPLLLLLASDELIGASGLSPMLRGRFVCAGAVAAAALMPGFVSRRGAHSKRAPFAGAIMLLFFHRHQFLDRKLPTGIDILPLAIWIYIFNTPFV
jgi:hypothetical protein